MSRHDRFNKVIEELVLRLDALNIIMPYQDFSQCPIDVYISYLSHPGSQVRIKPGVSQKNKKLYECLQTHGAQTLEDAMGQIKSREIKPVVISYWMDEQYFMLNQPSPMKPLENQAIIEGYPEFESRVKTIEDALKRKKELDRKLRMMMFITQQIMSPPYKPDH